MTSSSRRSLLVDTLCFADLVVMGFAFVAASVSSANWAQTASLEQFLSARVRVANLVLIGFFAVAWHIIFRSQALYRSHRIGRRSTEWWEVTKAVVIGTALLGTAALLLDVSLVTRAFLAPFVIIVLPSTLVMRVSVRALLEEARRKGRNLRRVIIIGCGRQGEDFGKLIRSSPELGYLLVGYVDDIAAPAHPSHSGTEKMLGKLADIDVVLAGEQVDEVWIGLPIKSQYDMVAHVIHLGEELGIMIRMPADPFQLRLASAHADWLDDKLLLTLQPPGPRPVPALVKRLIDVFASATALIVLLPFFVIIGIAIKVDSRGPVLFIQDRVGRNRRTFRLIKFRTMSLNAEQRVAELENQNEVEGAAFKIGADPRVSRSGRFLRKFSIDELPQFFNVLGGSMSLVGPRPLPLRDVERFTSTWQIRRFSVKPGLTCIWQANGRHDIEFEHWMELDLQYIDNWSLRLDFEILAKTVPAVLLGTGAS